MFLRDLPYSDFVVTRFIADGGSHGLLSNSDDTSSPRSTGSGVLKEQRRICDAALKLPQSDAAAGVAREDSIVMHDCDGRKTSIFGRRKIVDLLAGA